MHRTLIYIASRRLIYSFYMKTCGIPIIGKHFCKYVCKRCHYSSLFPINLSGSVNFYFIIRINNISSHCLKVYSF